MVERRLTELDERVINCSQILVVPVGQHERIEQMLVVNLADAAIAYF